MNLQAFQEHFIRLRNNKIFEGVVIAIIIISALLIGAKTYDIPDWAIQSIKIMDWAITIFFLIEISIRMMAAKNLITFFKNGWNVFDFIIVVASVVPFAGSDSALLGRLLRVFRVLRLVALIPELRVLLNAFMQAIPRMGYVSLLMFIIFYIYAAMGAIFFANINPVLWENITISMLTLFRVATFEDWTDVMYETMEVYPLSWIYYLSFIFIVAFVFLNMMIGIVLETLQSEHQKDELEAGIGEASEVHWIKEHTAEMEQRLIRIEALLTQEKRPRE